MDRLLEGWRYDEENVINHHKLMTFSTTSHQLYAFLRGLGLTNSTCIKEIFKGDRPLTVANSTKTVYVQHEDCLLVPEFGASLALELSYDESGNKFVRILYNNIPVEFGCLYSEVGGKRCPYAEFENIMAFSLSKLDHESYCKNKLVHELPASSYYIYQDRNTRKEKMLLAGSSSLALLLGICWLYKRCSSKRDQKNMAK
jgi:hypothetical protein